MTAPEIRELAADDLPAAVALLRHLNPSVPSDVLEGRFRTILAEHPHYHAFGAFVGGSLAGLAGAWLATKVWCGLYLEIDNLVVDPEVRSAGVGTALMGHLEAFAKEKGCQLVTLDSYTSNHASHRLYHRLGFEIWGFHFVKAFGPLDT